MKAASKPQTVTTLGVYGIPHGLFEVRDGLLVLGTSQNEMMAVWSAVTAAELMAKSGQTVRVVRFNDDDEIEEFVARPPGAH